MKQAIRPCCSLTCCIFAGGRATRLYPHTIPPQNQKSLLVMGNSTQRLIDYALKASAYCDHTLVITSSNHERAAVVEDYVLQWPSVYVLRDKREVAAGSLLDNFTALSCEDPDGDFVILAPDHVHEGLDLRDLHQHHLEMRTPVTVLTSPAKDYGEYTKERNGLAEGVLSSCVPGAISTCGTYVIKTRFLMQWIRHHLAEGWDGEMLSLYRDLVCPAIQNGKASIFPLPQGAYWDDAGTLFRYHQNNMRISKRKNVIAMGVTVSDQVALSESVVLADAVIEKPLSVKAVIISGSGDSFRITQIGG